MSFSGDPATLSALRRPDPAVGAAFGEVLAAAARAPLQEILPAAPGDAPAALGFALALALSAPETGLIVWAAPEAGFAEDGAPHAGGLAQFGVTLDRLLLARTRSQTDALWAAEEALGAPRALALCTILPGKKPLSLTATRRLLLKAEKHGSRCVLLRLDQAGASAAWLRWRIAAAPSRAEGRELGPPAFAARLERNRAGPAGSSWRLEWNAHAHRFHAAQIALDGALAAPPLHRAARPGGKRAA